MAAKNARPKRATPTEMRQEIAELRNIGNALANISWNIGQGREFTAHDRQICEQLCRRWDSIKRCEKRGL